MRRSMLMLALLLLASGCEENLINNPSFDRWCGESLCEWETVQGRVAQTSSWHKKDYAISFVETPTEITQLVKSRGGYSCILFELIADVAPEAQLTLRVDFDDDGKDVFEQLIPSVRWELTSFQVREPGTYKSIRYTLLKKGPGKAVLAQMWADNTLGCNSTDGP